MTTDDLEQVKPVRIKNSIQHNARYSVKKKSYSFPLQMRQYDGEIKLNGDVIPWGQNNSIQEINFTSVTPSFLETDSNNLTA